MVSPATAVAATRSASDSNLRCREGEWFRLQRPWRLRGPLPIPFSAAAKENGSACCFRSGSDLLRPILISLPRRRMVPPAVAVAATRSESDSNIRCSKEEHFRLQRALLQRVPRPIQISSLQRRMVPPAVAVAATRSASDTNFRCGKGERFRRQQS